jgi:pyrimidine deaminase RibD-like protein
LAGFSRLRHLAKKRAQRKAKDMRDDKDIEKSSCSRQYPGSSFASAVSQDVLDFHLAQALTVLERQWHAPDTGAVAACLLDPATGEAIYDVSRDIGHNFYSHAERNVIALYEKGHGRPPSKESVIITTLSPCVGDTSWRVGESCSDLLAKYGLRRLHVGLVDLQHPPHASHTPGYAFDITVTSNKELAKKCHSLRGLFNLKAPRHADGSAGRLAEAYKSEALFKSIFKPGVP